MLQRLLLQFIKSNGRKPNNLEMILLRQKASKEAVNDRKIVNMFDRQPVDANKPILGGKNIIETEEQILQRLNKQNKDSINRLKNKKDPPEELAGGGVAGLLGERRGRIGYANGSTNPSMPMQNQQALLNALNQQNFRPRLFDPRPFQKAPPTDYSKMMDKQTTYTPFNSGRIKDEFDKKTQIAFTEGAKISNQEFKNEPFDFTKDPFDKQGYSSDIRHGLGTSAFKDAVTDYITSNLGVNADTNLFKGITPENFGSFAANAGSLFTEVPDMFSQAKTVAESKGPYGSIDDYLDEPDTRFLTQPVEDIKANYVGSKIPFSLRNNLEGKKYFIDNFNKYGSNTMNQLKLNQERAMQDQIKKAADKAAAEKSQQQIRQAQTTASAQRNKDSGRGGYQSSFSQDKGFMGGSGTAAEMGSFAEGGPARQNFAMGKRAFLKLMGGVGAGIAGLKSGILGFGKKQATKKAVTETVKQAAGSGTPPPYFFKLVEKIKNLGDDATEVLAYKDRQKVTKYKDYELTEDLATGEQTIQRMKVLDDGSEAYYGQPLTKETYMNYKPGKGQTDETTGKVADEYEEGTALLRSDKQNVGEVVEEIDGVADDILEEVGETIVKKADGGRANFVLGGKAAGKGIMASINKLFGKGTMTTADKIKRSQQALDREMFQKFETNYPETGAADATLNIPVQQEGKFTKAEYLIQRLKNTIKQNPKDKYVKETFPNFIKELKDNPELAKNENVFKELGGDLPKGQQIVVYGDDSIDFFTQKSGPGNIDRIKKIMSKYNISKDKALKIMKMEPNDQVMEFKMLEIANRKLNATGGLARMLGE